MSNSLSVDVMHQKLLNGDTVECNSPKNRQRLYMRLRKEAIKFNREVIGDTGVTTSLWKKRLSAFHIVKWIESERITRDSFIKACDNSYNNDFADYVSLFDPKVSWDDKVALLEPLVEERNRGCRNVIDNCYSRKTIVRITLK